jgi:hypothetical protein
MNHYRRLMAAAVCLVGWSLAGCIHVQLPGSVNLSGSVGEGPFYQPTDPNSLPSVMHRLDSGSQEIGEELAEKDWDDLVRETRELVDWANHAATLSNQSRDPALFYDHCQALAGYAQAANHAALNHDAAAISNFLSHTGGLLAQMRQLVY